MSNQFQLSFSFTQVNVPNAILDPVKKLISDWWAQQAALAANPAVDAAVTLSDIAPNLSSLNLPVLAMSPPGVDDGDESDASTVVVRRKRKVVPRFSTKPMRVDETKRRKMDSFVDAADEVEYRLNPNHRYHKKLHPFLCAAKSEFGQDAVPIQRWKQLASTIGFTFNRLSMTNKSKVKKTNVGKFFPYLVGVFVKEEKYYRLHPHFFSLHTL